MTVGELIEKLKAFDSETAVVVKGFDESGYDDLDEPKLVEVIKIRNHAGHSGMYVDFNDLSPRYDTPIGKAFKAVLIDF